VGGFTQEKGLVKQINGTNDSWAIRWYASAFLQNKLTLYPSRSLVHNIGNDGSGRHAATTRAFDTVVNQTPLCIKKIPVEENLMARKEFSLYLRSLRESPVKRLKKKLQKLLSIFI